LDPIITLLLNTTGALVGTLIGIVLLRRKLRPPISDRELGELKDKMQTSEASLSAASELAVDLRKRLSLAEQALLQSRKDLESRQEQLNIASAETLKEKALRSDVERSAQELGSKVALLTEQCTKLEVKAREESDLAKEGSIQLVAVEGELEVSKRSLKELTEQAAYLTAQSIELKRLREQDDRNRTDLEAQLNAERDRIRQLSSQIAELKDGRHQLEVNLQRARAATGKGMELLLNAHETLSAAFSVFDSGEQNGYQGRLSLEEVVVG